MGYLKKEKYSVKINGLPFYIIVKRNMSGGILAILEKPNLKQIPAGHYIGEHIIINNPSQNHYDHASGAITWKEYSKQFNSKYRTNGNNFGVTRAWANPASFAIIA
jgi:hypothetical protein